MNTKHAFMEALHYAILTAVVWLYFTSPIFEWTGDANTVVLFALIVIADLAMHKLFKL